MRSHPLLELRFEKTVEGGLETVTRFWYHVPRVGDIIDIVGMAGIVRVVLWKEEHVYVEVEG